MMEAIPRDYGRGQFDAFCKKVLKNEARAYLRNMKRQRDRETMFSDLPQHELDKLCTVDRYPSDSFVFSSHGYDLHIDNELVADAFANKGKEPLPLSVYVSARAGDSQAVERLLRYYDNYMNCLCTRTLYDEDGYPHLCVDEYMKRCLEIRLIQAIVKV